MLKLAFKGHENSPTYVGLRETEWVEDPLSLLKG